MSSHMYLRFVAIFLATLVLVAFSNVGLIADSHFGTLQRKPIPTTNTSDKKIKTKMADDKDIDDAIAAAKKAAQEAKSKIKGCNESNPRRLRAPFTIHAKAHTIIVGAATVGLKDSTREPSAKREA